MTDDGHTEGAGSAGSRRRYAASRKASRARNGRWRKFLGIKALFLYFLGFAFLGVIGVGVVYAMTDIPAPNDFARSEATIVYWSDGETELGRFSAENRESVDISQIPAHVQNAVIAAEDRGFYGNSGFDPVGIARAGLGFIQEGGEIAGGGSTITQQYVKNYYLSQDQTFMRKFNELFVSIKIDQQLEKDDILASYLNTIWFGRGVYGVQTASKSYFGKPVSETSVEEGIALAAMLRSPHRYDPTLGPQNEERFRGRFEYVVDGMVEMGNLDQQAATEMKPPEVLPEQEKNRYGGPNGYLLRQVERELLAAGIDEAELKTGGLRVVTTFEKDAQQAALKAVKEERPEENAKQVRIGLAAVRPGDGAVIAMYGGRDAVEQPFNDAIDGKQQGGSTFKPFTLLAALEEGISLESSYAGNSPFDPPELGPEVNNQGDADYGEKVDLLEATERSINTAFVDLTMQMGADQVVDALTRAGIPENAEDLDTNARVTLGLGKVSTVEMADAYATIAAGGQQTAWYTVGKVTDRGGNVVHEMTPEPETVFRPDVVADATYAMTQVVEGANGTGQAARELGRPSAGKTGTHEEFTAWYAGFTPQLATAVSFINGKGEDAGTVPLDDVGEPGHFAAGGYPARVWTAFMKAALEGQEVIEFPEPAEVGEPVSPSPTASRSSTQPTPDESTQPPDDENGAGSGATEGGTGGSQNGNEFGGNRGGGAEGGGGTDGGDGTDSGDGTNGGTGGDTGEDWGGTENGHADGTDTGSDSGTDGGTDGGTDDGTDSGTETGTDTGNDSGTDTGTDSGTDGGTDGGTDDGTDSGTESGTDDGNDDGTDGGGGSIL